MNKRIISFDIIRGFAAIFVLLFHYTFRYNQMDICETNFNVSFAIPWGFAAVSTFFILSGYFSAKYLYDLNELKHEKWSSYLMNRFKRLYPAFFISVILTFTVTKLLLPVLSCDFMDFFLNFTMIPGLMRVKPVDGAYWTLFVEWVFYFIVALLLIKPNKHLTNIILLGWIVISILNVLLFGKEPSGLPRVINYFLVTNYCANFIAGISLWQIAKHKTTILTYVFLILSCVSQVLWQNNENISFFFVTVFLLLLVIRADIDKYLRKSKILQIFAWYGRISYPFYLVHQVIGYVILYYLLNAGMNSTWIILIPFLVATGLGYLFNEYAESLFSKLLKLVNVKF